ncbi:hypothetical protein HMPREF1870_00955 [Bacteroidales bacterium KA00344]|nr:hypothetical protein HMPREF1870_00955 [Bacteroidales bacterium KA00344]
MDKREMLKQFMRGRDFPAGGNIGFDLDLWGYLDSGEYNRRAVEACVSLLRWYRQEFGVSDRQSVFYKYIQELKKQGFIINI